MLEDTIAAIATAHGTGGIGIIRISGNMAFEVADKLYKGNKPMEKIKTHTFSYGKIIDPETGETVDEVLMSKMNKPNSFTREDVIEINCHGGIIVQRKILELVVKQGVRPAEPGEFTKRAFLNGRIDLSQAEAVIDLINAKTYEGTQAAVTQLEGRLSEKLREVRNILIELIAHIEVTVDYPEHDIEEITGQKVYDELLIIEKKLKKLIAGFDKGKIIREGITAVITGKPNVGKSSLLNELSGKHKAIVTDIPGTTRDIIEEYVNIKGIPVRLVDTAGIRETQDEVERIGVERAKKAVKEADLVISMLDAGQEISCEDMDAIEASRSMKRLVLLNKVDLVSKEKLNELKNMFSDVKFIETSLIAGSGIEELENEIAQLFLKGEVTQSNELLLTNIRHKNLIDMSSTSITQALQAYENSMPLDCITIDIKNAAEYLGQITGESVSEDVMKEIFSRFCIGK